MNTAEVGRTFKIVNTGEEHSIFIVDRSRELEDGEVLAVETSKGMNGNRPFMELFCDGQYPDLALRPSVDWKGQVFYKLYSAAGHAFADIMPVCTEYGIVPSTNFVERLTAPTGMWEPTKRSQLPTAPEDGLENDARGASKLARKEAKRIKRGLQPRLEKTARSTAVGAKGLITVSARISGTALFCKKHPKGGTKGGAITTPTLLENVLVKGIGNSWWTLEDNEGTTWYVREWQGEPTLLAATPSTL